MGWLEAMMVVVVSGLAFLLVKSGCCFGDPDSSVIRMPVCASLGVKILGLLLEDDDTCLADFLGLLCPCPLPYGMSGILAPAGGFRLLAKVTPGASIGSTGGLLEVGSLCGFVGEVGEVWDCWGG